MIVSMFKIVEILDDTGWEGIAKIALLYNEDKVLFKADIKGIDERYLKSVFENRDRYVGGEAYVQFPFYNHTNTGDVVPSMGTVLQLHSNPDYKEPEYIKVDLRDVRKVFDNIGYVS